jgi:hypothetical protein
MVDRPSKKMWKFGRRTFLEVRAFYDAARALVTLPWAAR